MKRKIISVLLCVALAVSVTPIVYAQDTLNSTIPITDTVSPTQTASEPYIVGEITEKRTENTKHFLMSDRSVMAAMYDEVVHYYDDGAWLDIDNSLSSNNGNEFENKSNSFKTKFSKKSNGNKLVTINKDGYSLSWMLEDADKVDAQISQSSDSKNEDISVLKNIQGTIIYPNIQNDVDLQYIVSGSNIKENIILQSTDAPTEYSFSYKFNKLQYRTNEDNQIEFYEENNPENIVFIIDAPYMYDSANVYSKNIEMQISETTNGLKLTLIPDKEWLLSKDRIYPIVIDPYILHDKDSENIWDITLKQSEPNNSEYTDVETLVGSDTSGNAYRTLMKFNKLPDIGSGGIIINAKMTLTAFPEVYYTNGVLAQKPRPTDDIQVNIHRVTQLWSEYGATWNSYADSYDPIVEDYFIYNDTDQGFTADITRIISEWYKATTYNYGIMLKASSESAANHVMQFTSSNFGDSSNDAHTSWRPYLMVNYRSCIGLEDYWSYTTYDMGGYGTGYVNNYNGNLTYIHDDLSYNSLINGFTLSHVYNSANSKSATGRYGTGWNLNLVQTIEPVSIEYNNDVKYVYTDGDGTKHYFVEIDGEIVDEDGLGYTLTTIDETVDSGTTPLSYKITTKDDTVLKFDAWGFLRRIIDTNDNTISLHYRPGETMQQNYISIITTSSGGYITLNYENNILSSITDNAGRTTSFSYYNGTLTQIAYPDGSNLVFDFYFETNATTGDFCWLKGITLPNGYQYCYDNDSKGKITTSCEKSSYGTQIGQLYYTYTNQKTQVSDIHDRYITYQFDNLGRATGTYDSHGNSYAEVYTPNSTTKDGNFANNKLSLASINIRNINNIITNPVFADELSSWSQYKEAPNETQISVVGDQTYISSKSIKISSTASSIQTLLQSPSTTAGKTYTLSANIKTENVVSATHGAAVEIVKSTPNGTSSCFGDFVTGTTDTEINDGFVTVRTTISLASDESIARIGVGLYNASGTVWIDSVQLEEGDTTNKINLLSNSSFEKNTGSSALPTGYTANFTAGTAGSCSSVEKHSGSYSLKISGNSSVKRYAYQTLNLGGKAGEVYSMGGWAKANAVANHSQDGVTDFKLTAGVYYTDGEYKEYPFALNEYTTEWQYVFGNFVMEKDYNKILIYCSYNFNANTAYFDDMFLYRDTAQSYKYDKDGNVISTADYANQQSSYSYDGASISKMLNPDGTTFEYGYDPKNNLVTSRSNVGVQYDIAYDQNGNPTSTSISADNYSTTIQSGKSYYIRLKGTGKYLTVDGDNACQASFTGDDNQKWLVEKAIKGGYYLYPQSATDKGLNVANNTQDGNITVATHSTSDTQRFDIELQSDYTYRIIAKCSTDNKLVTVPHAATQNNVAVWTPQGELNANQAWYFEDASIQPITQIEDGAVYQLRARHSGRYVSVQDNGTTNGTYLVQYAQNCFDSQKFIISKCGDDYYTLSPLNAQDKFINVTSQITSYECKLIEISDQQTEDTNLFEFVYNSQKGAYKIHPKSNPNECIAVAFSDCTDNASVVSAGINDSDNRYFVLEKVSDKIVSSATYQNNGNYPHTVTDSLGNTTTYTYDTARGLQTGITDAKGNTTTYNYNSLNDRLNSVSSGNSTVGYNYNNIGLLKRIVSPSGTSYQFTYDSYGNTKSVSIGTQKLSENFYVVSRGLLLYTAYSNGDTIKYTYDTLDRITEKIYNNVVKVKFRYDKFGNLYEKQDLFTNTTYRYSYDLIGRIAGISGSNGTSLNYVYDDFNRIQKYTAKFGDNSNVTEYIYGSGSVSGQKDGLVYGVKQNGTQRITYAYDNLARLNTRTLNTNTAFVTQYGYYDGATTGTTTTLIKTIQNGNDVYEYAYDSVGNITQIKLNDAVYESYTYDSLNQLTTVTRGNDTYTYTYDNGGNIQSVTKNGEVIKSYGYTDYVWRDKLTSYNGESITYDQIGNPLQYRDRYNFTWSNGRQLTGITRGSNSISYLYNADGLRTSKTVDGITTEYYWLEGVLLGQKTGNDIITYLYDENGSAYGLKYNNNYFYYVFNAQGDVVGIINQNGTQVVSYEYSAWGEVLSVSGYLANTLGLDNPIRYRGYYYDVETGFYLTGTRYYDPEIGRFINADNQISGVGSDIRGYNLFAYCFNNPVNMSDPTGNWPRWITATVAAVAAVVAVVATVVSAPVVATAAAAVVVVSTVAYVAQSHHYDKRAAKNTNLPQSPQEAKDSGWRGPDTTPKGPAADCHQYTAKDGPNKKYVSPDGHREVIYNSQNEIVLDARDIGTYNYSPSGTFWGSIGHFFADMLPWYLFGNDDDDPGPLANEIIRLFE